MKNLYNLFFLILWMGIAVHVDGQMTVEGETLLGNEWIDYDKEYLKIQLAEDGMYRLTGQDLIDAGWDLQDVEGRDLQLWHFGRQVPINVSTETRLREDDYFVFYGRKNRGELDRHLFAFEDESHQLNPEYSIFTDTSAYYLTWASESVNERVQVLDTDPNISSKPFVWYQSQVVYDTFYYKSENLDTRFSHYDIAEGFSFLPRKNFATKVACSKIYRNGPDAQFSIRFATNGNSHNQIISLNNINLDTVGGYGYGVQQLTFPYPIGDIKGNNTVRIKTDISTDRNAVAVLKIDYPRLLTLAGLNDFDFYLDSDPDQAYVFTDWEAGQNSLAYDTERNILVRPIQDGNGWKFSFEGATSNTMIHLFDTREYKSPLKLSRRRFEDFAELDPSYVMITNKLFVNDSEGVLDQYVSYRESQIGGGHRVDVIDVDEVIDQFAYGVSRHSIGMKNFGEWMVRNFDQVKYMLLVGKGRVSATYRKPYQIEDREGSALLVPTYGSRVGSDNLITSVGNSPAPRIATGRIAARSPQELKVYFDKLKTYESSFDVPSSIEDKLWQKQVIHLSGGTADIQAEISRGLNFMAEEIERNEFGAEVSTFYKTSSDILETSTSKRILNRINEGTRIITFFGHSSQGTFDFSLEDPSRYSNQGKLPLILSLGCFSGDIHTKFSQLSESFVLEPEKGAVAFMAASGTAFTSQQSVFGRKLYELMGSSHYGKPIGEMFQEVAAQFNDIARFETRTLYQQMTLHGDPAIVLTKGEGPDYVFDYETIDTDPEIITTNGDINVSVDVVNLCRALPDTNKLDVELIHYLPNGSILDTTIVRIDQPSNRSTVHFTIKNPGIDGVGRNSLRGIIDPSNRVEEKPDPAGENNNEIVNTQGGDTYDFFIQDNSIKPILPAKFAIVGDQDLALVASTSNVFQGESKYIFEIDTTLTFSSTLLKRGEVIQSGGTIEWKPKVTMSDGTVYYWRVSPDPSNSITGDYVWQDASFIYLPGSSEGWNQNHYYQFLADSLEGNMRFNKERELEFRDVSNYVKIVNNATRGTGERPLYIGNTFGNWGRMWIWEVSEPTVRAGIQVAVLAGKEDYWPNPPGGRAGSHNKYDTPIITHPFSTETPDQRMELISFLRDTVPDGYYVMIYSGQFTPDADYFVDQWEEDKPILGTTIFEVLEEEGLHDMDIWRERGSVPVTFMYRKGYKEVYKENIAESVGQSIETQWEFPRYAQEGEFYSPLVGPANNWSSLTWEEDLEAGDTTTLQVWGYKSNIAEGELLKSTELSYSVDLSDIDARTYPYIKLALLSTDQGRTAGNLSYWRVLYEGMPEATLISNSFQSDTLDRGESLIFDFDIKNLSTIDMDSILVKYSIVDANNAEIVKYSRSKALQAKSVNNESFELNTDELSGDFLFNVEINANAEQREGYYFNNFGVQRFFVRNDNINPSLDITFDGIRIMQGDYVSSTPSILVTLADENRYLLLDDPSAYELLIENVNSKEVTYIDVNDPSVIFTPATEGNNKSSIQFEPNLEDGTYRLVVNAKDASDNFAGRENAEIEFVVDGEAKISNVLNYPNPFSTSTQFVFTITGQVPDQMSIQIMTMSGKIVREISKEELGPIHIGINRSNYKWDGRDEYGSKLGNGVYLYRVITNLDGEKVKGLDTQTGDYFEEGFGKMVIMR